ncbi:hypothetical protein V6Z11_D09G159300 [Gossypium hirsutum]
MVAMLECNGGSASDGGQSVGRVWWLRWLLGLGVGTSLPEMSVLITMM